MPDLLAQLARLLRERTKLREALCRDVALMRRALPPRRVR